MPRVDPRLRLGPTIGLLLAMTAGCAATDPCDSFAGTCVSLHIVGDAAGADTLELSLSGAQSKSFNRALEGAALPITFAVLLADATAGALHIEVVARAGAGTVATGSADVTVAALRHQRADVLLARSAGGCSDGLRDGDESDVDCGGACAARCGRDRSCNVAADCAAGSCVRGRCGGLSLSFAGGANYATRPDLDRPYGLVLAPIFGGPRPDLAVASRSGVQLFVAPGNGTFVTPPRVPFTGSILTELVSGDFDGDHALDLAWLDELQGLSVAFGDGHGGWPRQSRRLPTGNFSHAAVVADLDEDQRDDVVVAALSAHQVTVVLAGDIQAGIDPSRHVPLPYVSDGIAAGDLDGDGHADIAVGSDDLGGVGENVVTLLYGAGDGTFGPPIRVTPGRAQTNCAGVAIGDVDGDGRDDLLASVMAERTIAAFPSRRGGPMAGPVPTPALSGAPLHLVTADFDRDGNLDVAVIVRPTMDTASLVGVLLGRGDGTFAPPTYLVAGRGAARVRTADLNGDQLPDLAVTNSLDTTVTVLLNTSS